MLADRGMVNVVGETNDEAIASGTGGISTSWNSASGDQVSQERDMQLECRHARVGGWLTRRQQRAESRGTGRSRPAPARGLSTRPDMPRTPRSPLLSGGCPLRLERDRVPVDRYPVLLVRKNAGARPLAYGLNLVQVIEIRLSPGINRRRAWQAFRPGHLRHTSRRHNADPAR